MSVNPLTMLSGGGGDAGAGVGGPFGTFLTALKMLKATNDIAGPRGALVTGDVGQGVSAAQNLYSGGQSMFGNPAASPTAPSAMPTTQSAMGLTPEEFNRIPPEVRQELLRKLAGR